MTTAERVFSRLTAFQAKHAGAIIVAALVLAAACVPFVMRLGLNSDWSALLPTNTPSVQDLQLVKKRFGGISNVFIAIESKDFEAMKHYARDVAPKLEAMGPPVRHVVWTVTPYEAFVEKHRHLYADLPLLKRVNVDLQDRITYEKAKANPFYLDLEDGEGEAPPTIEAIVEGVKKETQAGLSRFDQYPDGFYVHPKRDLLVILVRTSLESDDVASAEQLLVDLRRICDSLKPETYAKDLRVRFAGDIPEVLEEHRAITNELVIATVSTILLVLLAIVIFFRRLRAVPLLFVQLLTPVLLTFAVAQLTVGYLNTSTAFLASIVIGNGANPGTMWLSRYFEERRNGHSPEEASRISHVTMWAATLTASAAAGIAYTSLVVTDFRGFRDFGIIGGVGMAFCWIGTMTILPAACMLADRYRPMTFKSTASRHGIYGAIFDRCVKAAPGGITFVSATLGVASLALIVYAVWADPLEYDLRNLRSVREGAVEATLINDRVNEFMPRTDTGTVVAALAPSLASAQALEIELEKNRDEGRAVYGNVTSVFDTLPKDQEKKIPILAEIRHSLLKIRDHVDDQQRALIDEYMPPAEVSVLTPDQVPHGVTAPFTEIDGTIGRVVVIEQGNKDGNWDGRYLVAWCDDVRKATMINGKHPPLAGRPPIIADMLAVIWHDGPLAIAVSFLATFILVLLAFSDFRSRLLMLTTLLIGIAWMGGWMTLFSMKLNFLNFVAFPIMFGNGVDYGVNVLRRYQFEVEKGLSRDAAVSAAIRGAGGAVALCSITTVIGYMSLYASANLAINSFGAAMGISELTCTLAAVLTLPAYLLWSARREAARAKA